MYRGEGFFKYEKKEFQSALFRPLGRWTGNKFLFQGGLTDLWYVWLCVGMFGLNHIPVRRGGRGLLLQMDWCQHGDSTRF